MSKESPDFIPLPIWMLLSAALGFLAGEIYGDLQRHRKCLQQANNELRERLEKGAARTEPIDLTLSRLLAVAKGLEKRSS
jgi:hypothetical protein